MQSGDVVQTLDYFPFGDLRLNEKNSGFDSKRKFTGHEHDSDTNLSYMFARYQNPATGLFLSVDPWEGNLEDPQSLNKYSYSRNNPIKYVDPNGEMFEFPGLNHFSNKFSHVKNTVVAQITGAKNAVLEALGWTPVDDVNVLVNGEHLNGEQADNADKGFAVIGVVGGVAGKADDVAGAAKKIKVKSLFNKKPDGSSYTKTDIKRMEQGKAPLDSNGTPIELHHENQNPNGPLVEMTRDQYRGAGNYQKNHPNGNQQPSQINRNEFNKQRLNHWKNKSSSVKIK